MGATGGSGQAGSIPPPARKAEGTAGAAPAPGTLPGDEDSQELLPPAQGQGHPQPWAAAAAKP